VYDSRGIEIVNFTTAAARSGGTLMASAGTPYRLVPAHFYPCGPGAEAKRARYTWSAVAEGADVRSTAVVSHPVNLVVLSDLHHRTVDAAARAVRLATGPVRIRSYNTAASLTKHLTTAFYDNAEVTIDLRRSPNLQNILYEGRKAFLGYNSLAKA